MPDELRSRRVTILSLADKPAGGCGISGDACCGSAVPQPDHPGTDSCTAPRVPVLACRDALISAGVPVRIVTACSDAEIDAVVATLDGPARPDRLTFPAVDSTVPTLIVAAASDGQLRAVVRRMVRRYAPPPSRRPADLATGRTLPDLPAIGVLPLDIATRDIATRGAAARPADLVDRLGLPRDPAEVAKAVLGGRTSVVDLFRTDGGSLTLHGALLGGVDESGQAVGWRGRVELDDTVLANGREPVLACAIANANGYAHLDELLLAPDADPGDGLITVAVAVPMMVRSRLGNRTIRIEVRRASGRAVSVTPAGDLPFVDDGVAGMLTRKRSWWVEPAAWSAYTLATA